MVDKFCLGRETRHNKSLEYLVYIALCCPVHNEIWQYHVAVFREKPSGFEKKMWKTIKIMESVLFKHFVFDFEKVFRLNEKA